MAIRPYVGEEALRELVRQIKSRTASVYTVKGSIGVRTYNESTQEYVLTPANLPYYMYSNPSTGIYAVYDSSGNVVQPEEGWVFNLAIDYTVPADSVWFIDKVPGDIIKAGTNICVVNSETLPNEKFDCLATDVDLTPYQTKRITDNDLLYSIFSSICTDRFIHTPPHTAAEFDYPYQIKFERTSYYDTLYTAYYVYDPYDTLTLSQSIGTVSSSPYSTSYTFGEWCTVEHMLACITAYMKNVKQDKELSSALTMLTPDFTYATVAAMPTTGATAEGIETGDIAYVTETTKLYQATVDGSDNITWAEIGDQTTVEGAIKLLGSLAPNRPVTAAEVQSLFNS